MVTPPTIPWTGVVVVVVVVAAAPPPLDPVPEDPEDDVPVVLPPPSTPPRPSVFVTPLTAPLSPPVTPLTVPLSPPVTLLTVPATPLTAPLSPPVTPLTVPLSPPVTPLTVLFSPPAAWFKLPVMPPVTPPPEEPPVSAPPWREPVPPDPPACPEPPPVPATAVDDEPVDPPLPEDPPDVAVAPLAAVPAPAAVEFGAPRASAGAASAEPAEPAPVWFGPPFSACGAMNAAATAAPVTATPAIALRRPPAPAPCCCTVALRCATRKNARRNERAGGDEEAGQRLLRFGDDGELALECLAGPPQQRLDRPDLDALVVRDLLVGPSRALPHGEHVAVACREAVERAVDQFAVDRSEDEILGRVLTHHTDGMLRSELQVVGGRAARAATQHVGADVAGDHGQPRVEATLAGEARQRLPRAGERLLRGVLGLVAIVEPAHAEAKQPLVVPRVQVAERRRVPGLATLDERAVAIEIDVVAKAAELFLAERQCSCSSPSVAPLNRR